jgi:hypothetical protein
MENKICCITKHYAKGLCHSCYDKKRHAEKRESLLANKRMKYALKSASKLAANKIWYQNNKNKHLANYNLKRSTDINYRLAGNIRSRLNSALKLQSKSGSAVNDLGCSISELKMFLESKFLPGMTWNNYGLKGWHIDHIIPLSAFDLSNKDQFIEACHYSNLQPLWASDNIRKRNKR